MGKGWFWEQGIFLLVFWVLAIASLYALTDMDFLSAFSAGCLISAAFNICCSMYNMSKI